MSCYVGSPRSCFHMALSDSEENLEKKSFSKICVKIYMRIPANNASRICRNMKPEPYCNVDRYVETHLYFLREKRVIRFRG